MDNEKNVNQGRPVEKKDDSADAANRARNRTVMLTPEVTGQVRAMLTQDRPQPQDPFARESREPKKNTDDFAPIFSANANPMTSIITREPKKETPSSGAYSQPVEHRPAAATGAPIDPSVIQAARQNSVGVVSVNTTPIIGFLVSYDKNKSGEVLELRTGRWIVSSERTSEGNFLIVKDSSVSPLHAILKISDAGEIQVLDQLSEHGTTIKHVAGEEEKLAGSMGTITHGDLITFGERVFNVCLVQKQ